TIEYKLDNSDWVKIDKANTASQTINYNGSKIGTITLDKAYNNNVDEKNQQVTATFSFTGNYDGKIYVRAYDDAENLSDEISGTIRNDVTNPQVTKFEFSNATSEEGVEGSANVQADYEYTDYGFFFKTDTTVTVTVEDAGSSSGFTTVYFYMIKKDSDSIYKSYLSSNFNVEYDGNNAAKTTAKFTVEANFKGQIYAYVVDGVGNASFDINKESVKNCEHPADATVVESKSQHDSTYELTITRPTTTLADSDSTPLYNSAQDIQFKVGDSVSGIRYVNWYVENQTTGDITQSGELTIGYSGTFSGTDTSWSVDSKDKNLVTEISKTISVGDSDIENYNNMLIHIDFTDRSGNVSEVEEVISIDKTTPQIDVVFDAASTTYKTNDGVDLYDADRTAEITITERNFDPENTVVIVDGNVQNVNWQYHAGTAGGNGDDTTYTASVSYEEGDNHSLEISTTDLAGNKAVDYESELFSIDTTDPTIQIDFSCPDNTNELNNGYYNADRIATITITDHNFNAGDVDITMKSYESDNNTVAENPKASDWVASSANSDVHTAQIEFDTDGRYSFTVNYVDLAGHEASEAESGEFVIDKVAPTVDLQDSVSNEVAYGNVELAPVFMISDYNLYSEDAKDSMLSISFERVDVNGKTDKNTSTPSYENYIVASNNNGYVSTHELDYANFDIDDESVDGIYTLSYSATDLAGNTSSDSITFSVNRFGSTYRIVNEEAQLLIDNYSNGIYANAETKIQVEEINATEIENSSIAVTMDNSDEVKLTEGNEYTVSQNRTVEDSTTAAGKGWYSYIYDISADNFSSDALYNVILTSQDVAGNLATNSTPTAAKNKLPISFIIDKTAPEIVISGIEDGEMSKESNVTLNIICSDLHLADIHDESLDEADLELVLNGNTISVDDTDTVEISTNDSDDIILKLNVSATESSSKQELSVQIRDCADNWSDAETGRLSFTLSATWLDLLLSSKLGIVLSIIAIILILAAVTWFIFFIKRRKKKEQES
ncbi:MAG: hypothetical protein LUH08_02670, partial [Ruminococcus sp.]|nr:hypothetical protein [Ruminococcus sp.]